ncbi:MAG: hypothetical protein QXX94_02580 [Candidatus Bathyarchaeia archaeon]
MPTNVSIMGFGDLAVFTISSNFTLAIVGYISKKRHKSIGTDISPIWRDSIHKPILERTFLVKSQRPC